MGAQFVLVLADTRTLYADDLTLHADDQTLHAHDHTLHADYHKLHADDHTLHAGGCKLRRLAWRPFSNSLRNIDMRAQEHLQQLAHMIMPDNSPRGSVRSAPDCYGPRMLL
eukprot:1153588-Pelagomonas_calceolata.AAC.4